MESEEKIIKVYDKREKCTSSLCVIELSENIFRMADNDIFNCNLTRGTEFQTRMNDGGVYEIIQILKASTFKTRRFFLSTQFRTSEYEMLGEEIIRHGGYWQVDFGGIATINLPEGCELDLDVIFRLFDFKPMEIK